MLKGILEPLLERFGRATVLSAPTRYELVLGHAGYGIGVALIGGVVARLAGYSAPVGIGQVIGTVGLCAALGSSSSSGPWRIGGFRPISGSSPISCG